MKITRDLLSKKNFFLYDQHNFSCNFYKIIFKFSCKKYTIYRVKHTTKIVQVYTKNHVNCYIIVCPLCTNFSCVSSGADLGFSRRGEGGFSEHFRDFVDLFYVKQIDFSSSKSTKKALLWPSFLRRRQKFEKTGQKRALHSKLVYIGAHGAFRTFLGSPKTVTTYIRHQKRMFQNSTIGEPFGSAGGRIPEGGRPPT